MARRIAIFADGTGNTGGKDESESNVIRLCRMFDIGKPAEQLVIYHPGVGTRRTTELEAEFRTANGRRLINDSIEPPSRLSALCNRVLGMGFGYGTERNIKQLYRALAESYAPGACVYVFGFSRGAFTARALAGLIYRCGVVKEPTQETIDEAYRLYRTHYEKARNAAKLREMKRAARAFKLKNSHPCNVRFLGIFDTVKSVGYLNPRNLPHTRHNPIVQTVRHALALDERRSFYEITTWGGLDADTRPAIYAPACWDSTREIATSVQWQDVEEVWFAGAHADVGGGYRDCSSPADVSLRWMLEEARAHGLCVSPEAPVGELARTFAREHLHDEMGRRGCPIGWFIVNRIPRVALENEPPPPRKVLTWSLWKAKRREISESLRNEAVAVHHTAMALYEDDPRFASISALRRVTRPD